MHTGGWAFRGQRLCAITLGCLASQVECVHVKSSIWGPPTYELDSATCSDPKLPFSVTHLNLCFSQNKPSGQIPKVDKPFQKYYLCHCCSYCLMPGNSCCVFQLKSNVTRQLLPEALSSIPGSFPCNLFHSPLTPLWQLYLSSDQQTFSGKSKIINTFYSLGLESPYPYYSARPLSHKRSCRQYGNEWAPTFYKSRWWVHLVHRL